MTTVRLHLPWPCSVNTMFPTAGKRRIRSERYEKWRREAGWMLKAQRPHKFAGPVNLRIDLVLPDRRHRDAANYEKGITDLLVEHGILPGDDERFVRRVSIGWEDEGEPCTVTITACDRSPVLADMSSDEVADHCVASLRSIQAKTRAA